MSNQVFLHGTVKLKPFDFAKFSHYNSSAATVKLLCDNNKRDYYICDPKGYYVWRDTCHGETHVSTVQRDSSDAWTDALCLLCPYHLYDTEWPVFAKQGSHGIVEPGGQGGLRLLPLNLRLCGGHSYDHQLESSQCKIRAVVRPSAADCLSIMSWRLVPASFCEPLQYYSACNPVA